MDKTHKEETETKSIVDDEKIQPEHETKKIKGDKRKRKRVFWITTTIAEQMGREALLQSTLIEMLIFLLFLIVVVFYCRGLRNPTMYYLSHAIRSQFIEPQFDSDGRELSFETLRAMPDFWNYLDHVLLENLFKDSYYTKGDLGTHEAEEKNMILFENKILGVPRIRQVRVANQSCTIHGYFKRIMNSCFATFTEKSEDWESFGLKKGTAWTFNHPKITRSLPFWGYLSTYSGGGFYADLTKDKESSNKIIADLKANHWVDRPTRAIFIDFSVYNANINMFIVCKLVIEFPAAGGLYTSYKFKTVDLVRIGSIQDYYNIVCEYVEYALVVFFLCEEIREMVYFRFAYFTQFWTYVDLVIIGLCISSFAYSWKLGLIVLPNQMDQVVPEDLQEVLDNPDEYGNLERISELHVRLRELVSVMLFLNGIKLFKYLNFNRTMGQLNNTLEKCALDILGFSVMFLIAFIAFSELGYLIFGSQVAEFSEFGTSMFTLLRTILGDFDYRELQKTNRILAPIYFISYIFLVFFVLLNMFLAIITDTYSDVKTEIALTQREMQMTDFLKIKFNKLLRKLGCKQISMKLEKKKEFNITISKLRDALRKCGFTDIEAEMFFARYDIDPMANITEADIDRFTHDYGKAETQQKALKDTYVKISDFMVQETKIEEIEDTIATLAERLSELLQKLERVPHRANT